MADFFLKYGKKKTTPYQIDNCLFFSLIYLFISKLLLLVYMEKPKLSKTLKKKNLLCTSKIS